jgi:hypothetical protein
VKPSAHWQQRAHYSDTAAALRGAQLADSIKGKRRGDATAVVSLTGLHSFDQQLSGTVTLQQWPVC